MADQSMVPQDGGFWVGLAAFATAVGSVFRRRGISMAAATKIAEEAAEEASQHAKTKAQEAITRVATVEGKLDGIQSRLGAIESGQRELTARIDRVLERL